MNDVENNFIPTEEMQGDIALKRSRRKWIILGICSLILVFVIVFQSALLCALSTKLMQKQKYGSAQKCVQYLESDKAKALRQYAALRLSVRENFPTMSKTYDPALLSYWVEVAGQLKKNGAFQKTTVYKDFEKLNTALSSLKSYLSDYESRRTHIEALSDVFREYNRLHLATEDGFVSFTTKEELQKLRLWQAHLNALNNYAVSIPSFENVYLFSYYLKEAQSEITQLEKEIQAVTENGYSPEDTVRYSDNTARTFPTVNKGGVRLNLAEGTAYTEQMEKDLQAYLITTLLLPFYNE